MLIMAKRDDAATDVERLAKNVRTLRLAQGMSTHALDTKAGLSIGVTSRVENKKRPRVEMKTVQAIASALGVSADALIHDENAAPPPLAPRPELVVERVEMPTELAELLAAERAAGRGWPQQVIDAALTLRHLQGERLSHADWRTFLNEVELTGRRPLKVPAYQVPVPTAEEAAAAQAARIEAVLKKRRENNE